MFVNGCTADDCAGDDDRPYAQRHRHRAQGGPQRAGRINRTRLERMLGPEGGSTTGEGREPRIQWEVLSGLIIQ